MSARFALSSRLGSYAKDWRVARPSSMALGMTSSQWEFFGRFLSSAHMSGPLRARRKSAKTDRVSRFFSHIADMNERRANMDALAVGLMVLFCALWGFNQVAAKISNMSFSPLFQAGIRSTGATILLYIWCLARGEALLKRDGSLLPGIAAGCLFDAEFGLIFWGLKYTTVSRGIIFLYTAPFVVAGGLH